MLDFFNSIKEKQKGIKNLIEKVYYYDDDLKILTEKARSSLKLNEYLTDGDELNAV